MFIIEQHIDQNMAKGSSRRVFSVGMPLVNRRNVKHNFTYKEFTLVLGVFVAMIVAITLWVNKTDDRHTYNRIIPTSEKIIPAISTLTRLVRF